MQPTLPPWAWVSWEVRTRGRARDHNYAVYDVRKDTRHFIRLDRLGKTLLLNRPWAGTAAPPLWHYDRFDNTSPWTDHDVKSVGSFQPAAGGAGAGAGAGEAADAGAGARGWAVAAVVFAVFLMLVRVSKICLIAALKSHPIIINALLRAELNNMNSYRMDEVQHREAPPAYAECVNMNALYSDEDEAEDEPPPPYTACCGAGTAPDAAGPRLLEIHTTPTHTSPHERPHSTTDFDNAQNDLIENGISTAVTITDDNIDYLDSGGPMDLVFADGRVLERVPADSNTGSDTAAGNDAKELSKDKVVYIDETATNNATPDRVLLV